MRDATLEGVHAVERKLDKDAINAVVAAHRRRRHGVGPHARGGRGELERAGRAESGQIRVFTIAYGTEPNEVELARYAEASGGKAYKGAKDDIESVYLLDQLVLLAPMRAPVPAASCAARSSLNAFIHPVSVLVPAGVLSPAR